MDTDAILDQTGRTAPQEIATAIRTALPDSLHAAARSPDESLLLVVAMALAVDDPARDRQLVLLEQPPGPPPRHVRHVTFVEPHARSDDREPTTDGL